MDILDGNTVSQETRTFPLSSCRALHAVLLLFRVLCASGYCLLFRVLCTSGYCYCFVFCAEVRDHDELGRFIQVWPCCTSTHLVSVSSVSRYRRHSTCLGAEWWEWRSQGLPGGFPRLPPPGYAPGGGLWWGNSKLMTSTR